MEQGTVFLLYDVHSDRKIQKMNLGKVFFQEAENFEEQRNLAAAISSYSKAENAGFTPDVCAAARWKCYMLAGDWTSAWKESDAIAKRGEPDPHRFWNGSDWAGRDVLIRCLHGLGDTLQFIRFSALVRERARSLTIEAQPTLKALLDRSNLADHVITWGEPEPEWQVQMEVNELPRIFRITPSTIPARVPYLRVVADRRLASRVGDPVGDPVGGPCRIGLVWAGSSFDEARNIPFELLKPLFQIPGLKIFSLQGGGFCPSPTRSKLVDLIGTGIAVEEVADYMASLDLILTVDTMAAHLAGALGRPVWTMLRYQCDWRWMKDGSDTPWYPTMRLFRQQCAGDWTTVIADVAAALLQWRDSVLFQRGLGAR